MESSRFQDIRTLRDIRIQKMRLKRQLIEAENRLEENYEAIQSLATISTLISSISYGFEMVQKFYQRIRDFFAWFSTPSSNEEPLKKKKKKNKSQEE